MGRQLVDTCATQQLAGGGAEDAHVKGASRRAILIAGRKPSHRLLPVERGSAPAHPFADRLDGFVGRADKLVGIVRLALTPDDERRTIGVSVTAKSTLAATNPVATALYVTSDGNGELVVAEMVPQVPGQMNMDGTQQEAPKLLKLVQHG